MFTGFLRFFPVVFFVVLQSFSQGSVVDINEVIEDHGDYFELPRENLFLHLNKDIVVVGEELWFKGYAYDQMSKKPSIATTTVYLGIYDSIGRQKQKRILYSEGGYFSGSIPIDTTFVDGRYFVRATTNWMRNFKEDNSYVQSIRVMSDSFSPSTEIAQMEYSIQLFPEGGNLVSGLANVVGAKVTGSNGKGLELSDIEVLDGSGRSITSFGTNSVGIGKFEFTPISGTDYGISAVLPDGTRLNVPVPSAVRSGMVLRVQNNPYADKVLLHISKNFEVGTNGNYHLLLHQDGISSVYPIRFDGSGGALFALIKEELPHGVNIATIFDSNGRPIIERMFYVDHDSGGSSISVEQVRKVGDSIRVSLRVEGPSNVFDQSVSVLPEGTMAYGHRGNIESTFRLRPYVKGFIENPAWYFKDGAPKRLYALDLLLLVQGWSRYDWGNLFAPRSEPKFEFEDGLRLLVDMNLSDAKLSNWNQLMLYGTKSHGSQVFQLEKENQRIVVEKYFPEKGDTISLSLMGKKGKLKRPGAIVNIVHNQVADRLDKLNEIDYGPDITDFSDINNFLTTELIETDNSVVLDDVTVYGNRISDKVRNNVSVPAFLRPKIEEIDEKLVFRFPMIADLIRSRGYEVRNDLSNGVFSVTSRRNAGMLLVLDGVRQPNLDFLINLPSTQIESFYFDRLSRFEGVMSNNQETLYLFTRKGKELDSFYGLNNGDVTNRLNYVVTKGYEPKKEFYAPLYSNYLDRAFQSLGAIHWSPSVQTDSNGIFEVAFLDTDNQRIRLQFEGMDREGRLLSNTTYLDLEDWNLN